MLSANESFLNLFQECEELNQNLDKSGQDSAIHDHAKFKIVCN